MVTLYLRHPRWLRWGAPCLLLALTVNHTAALWHRHHASARASSDLKLNVKMADTADHNTIGIDEASLPANEMARFLHFSTLGLWDYQQTTPHPCPAPLQALNGKRFSSVGFMYPLQAGNYVKTFCLLRSTQTCCYGPRPQFNQYILVETKSPVAFERLTPVIVNGTFFVDPEPADGYIYRMEADAVQPVDDDTTQIDAPSAAQQAHLPLFDFGLLTALHTPTQRSSRLQELRALAGKTVVVAGYCVARTRATLPRLTVSNAWWDGIAQGEPPTPYNSVQVLPADEQQAPPLWKDYEVFTGVVRLVADLGDGTRLSGVELQESRSGVPGVTSASATATGPPIPWQIEALLIGCVFCGSLGWRRSTIPGASVLRRRRFGPLPVFRSLLVVGLVGLVYGIVHYTTLSDLNAELAAAVSAMDTKKALMLLEQGADPNGMTVVEPNSGEWTQPPVPLLQDAARRATESAVMVKILLDHGAHIEAKDNTGKTALMVAVSLPTTDAAQLLMDRGAALETRDNSGWTALQYAVEKKQSVAARLLLIRGANANTQDNNGKSPLMISVDNPEMVKLLLDKGGRADTRDHNGWTAFMYATKNSDAETVRLLHPR